jgi:hypothetical protein
VATERKWLISIKVIIVCIVKLNLFLCLIKHHATKTYGGEEVYLHLLTSALHGVEWSAPRSLLIYRQQETLQLVWRRGSAPTRNRTPIPCSYSPQPSHYSGSYVFLTKQLMKINYNSKMKERRGFFYHSRFVFTRSWVKISLTWQSFSWFYCVPPVKWWNTTCN